MSLDHVPSTTEGTSFAEFDVASIAAKAGGENFPVALRVLSAHLRRHLQAIYSYARFIDDLGDRYEGDRLAALDRAEAELDRAFAHEPSHPVFAEIVSSIEMTGAGRAPLDGLIAANRLDQHKTEYAEFSEFMEYCALSANPVGRLVLAAFGTTDAAATHHSDLICTALQIVEHLQDLGEDARDGRVYFPKSDLESFGVTRDDLLGSAATPGLRRLVAFEASRARRMLDEGAPLVGRFSGMRRLALAGFVGGGYAQLAELERRRFDVLTGLAQAPKRTVLGRTVALAVGATGGRR